MIGYQLNGNILERDNTSTGTDFQPVAENVQSLTLAYFKRNGDQIDPEDPTTGTELDIDRVQVSLEMSVEQGIGNAGTQELTSVIDLRNRQ